MKFFLKNILDEKLTPSDRNSLQCSKGECFNLTCIREITTRLCDRGVIQENTKTELEHFFTDDPSRQTCKYSDIGREICIWGHISRSEGCVHCQELTKRQLLFCRNHHTYLQAAGMITIHFTKTILKHYHMSYSISTQRKHYNNRKRRTNNNWHKSA